MNPTRRRRFKTQYLRDVVHPTPLKELLRDLKLKGEVEWYRIWRYTTIIKLTKHSGLAMMLEEASKPVVNPRPYVNNDKARKTKR